jgi:hypothetical protein
MLILQPHLINNLQTKFGNEVEKKRVYKTPGTPRFKFVRPSNEDDTIDGNLHSRTDFCNVVRELSRCMDKATMGTYLEMLRVIKFIIDTKNFGLRVQPPRIL